MLKFFVVVLILTISLSLKVHPPHVINNTNFKQITGVTADEFLINGSNTNRQWFLLFKIQNCNHCKQAEMLFNSFFVEYQKKIHFQQNHQMDSNYNFAYVDCQASPSLCGQFNIQQYPTYYVVRENGDICNYISDRMPFSLINYLEQRKRGEGNQKCKQIGKITIYTKILSYLEPLLEFINYNTMLFVVAFIIGPFLFGYVFSRNKTQKKQSLQVEGKQD